jgi:hypothetical protein
MIVGFLVGFLIKHEIDIRQRKKRIQQQQMKIAKKIEPFDETLSMIRDLNESLLSMQNNNQRRGVH